MKFKIAVCAILLGVSISAWGKTIKLATGEWAPCIDSNVKNQGWCSQIVKEAFALENIKIELEFLPWARVFGQVKTGSHDASYVWSFKKERAKDMLYSEKPISFAPAYVLYHRKILNLKWKTFSDLKKLNIGLTRSYNYKEFEKLTKIDKSFRVEYVTSDIKNMKKLIHGRIDVFPMPILHGEQLLKDHFTEANRALITYNKTPFSAEKATFMIFPKSRKSSAKLKDTFDRGMVKLIKNGRYKKITAAGTKKK